jgi:5'-nucleotidase
VKLDPATRDVVSAKADTVIARTSLAADADQSSLPEAYDRAAALLANRRAGSVKDTLSRVPNLTGESVLGDIIADPHHAHELTRARRRQPTSPLPLSYPTTTA